MSPGTWPGMDGEMAAAAGLAAAGWSAGLGEPGGLPAGPGAGAWAEPADVAGIAEPAGPLPASAALSLAFDADRMAAEVDSLRPEYWEPPGPGGGVAAQPEDGWRILPLRSLGGDPDRTDPGGAGLVPFEDTDWLWQCDYLREVLTRVPAPLRSVRLMSLAPGASAGPHRHGKYGLPYGMLRMHVPVLTSPEAVVVIDGVSHEWDRGRLWYADFNRPHQVRNDGPRPRIDLVIDTLVTQALLELFPAPFQRSLPAGQALTAREPIPLEPARLIRYWCRFTMPESFADWAGDELEAPWSRDILSGIQPVSGRFALLVSGEPLFGLVHLGAGEFRFEGWSEERTLHVDPDGQPQQVTFCVRRGRSRRLTSRPLR
jgi:aspartyl/asparaginyl beta-hydroxylase